MKNKIPNDRFPEADPQLESAVWSVVSKPIDAAAVERVKGRAKRLVSKTTPTRDVVVPDEVFTTDSDGVETPVETSRTKTMFGRFMGMRRRTRVAIAATVTAAFLGVFSSIVPSSSSVAFADVLNAIKKVRTATWNVTVNVGGPNETTAQGKGMFLEPALQRLDLTTNGTTTVSVTDFKKGEVIALDPAKKSAVIYRITAAPAATHQAGFQMLCELSENVAEHDTATPLGESTIDGKAVVGFRIVGDVGDMEIWSDRENGLPVKIEVTGKQSNARTVMSNFQFNGQVDRELLSMRVPDGYESTDVAIDMSGGPERFVTAMLRAAATANDGVFPAELLGKRGLDGMAKEIMESIKARGVDTEKATRELIANLSGSVGMLSALSPDNRHYAGANVKLNEKDRPIFWYQPKGIEGYRVIYADLTVKEMKEPPRDTK
jgi:outer membrane lipoprotein-sorting protein